MEVITVEPKSHKHNLDAQFFFKQCTNRNASSATYRDRLFSKAVLNCRGSAL